MFTWICPQCGREVPPSYTECPDCSGLTAKSVPSADAAPPAAPSQATPPPVPAAIPISGPVAAPPGARAKSAGLPGWLLTIVFTFAFVGVGACIYWGVNYYKGRNQGGGPTPAVVDTAAKGVKTHPLQKHLEIAGVRFIGDQKKPEARFLLVNHSEAEIANLAGTITIWARTQRSEEDAVGTVAFKVAEIGPNQSREVTAPLNTKLKIYELPDWQNVTTDVQLTSPPAQ